VIAQATLLTLYVGGALYLFVIRPRRRRRDEVTPLDDRPEDTLERAPVDATL